MPATDTTDRGGCAKSFVTGTPTDTLTDRQTNIQIDIQAGGRQVRIGMQEGRLVGRRICIHTDRQTVGQAGRQADRQKDGCILSDI